MCKSKKSIFPIFLTIEYCYFYPITNKFYLHKAAPMAALSFFNID